MLEQKTIFPYRYIFELVNGKQTTELHSPMNNVPDMGEKEE